MRKNIYILLCILFAFAGCSNLPAEHTVVSVRSGEVRLPIKDFSDGKVHFFTYKKDGKRINFFVRTDGKDNLSAYFDVACYVPEDRGKLKESGFHDIKRAFPLFRGLLTL